MQTLLTENFLGLARSSKDLFCLESESGTSVLYLDNWELNRVVVVTFAGGHSPVNLKNSQILEVRAAGDKVNLCCTNGLGVQEVTFNLSSFLNLLDPDMVRSAATALQEAIENERLTALRIAGRSKE